MERPQNAISILSCCGSLLVMPHTVSNSNAEKLTGIRVENDEDAAKAAQVLHEKGIRTVLITLGSRGVWASVNGEGQRVPGFRVQAVDTIAAGDTFNGALITALLEEKPCQRRFVLPMQPRC